MQPRQRRFLLPTVLAAVAVLTGALAVRAGRDTATAAVTGAQTGPTTPVLSARRVAPYLVAPIADAKLQLELAQVVQQSPGATCLTVSVGGRLIYQHNPDLPLIPASTEKLVTATAALAELGPKTRLRTNVVSASGVEGGTIRGDLFLVGGGDPVLATDPYVAHFASQPQIRTSLEKLADSVKAAGVTVVEGRVVGDESRYDSDRYPDSWPQRYADQSQSGPLTALSVNDGFAAWPDQQTREGTVESTAATNPPQYAAEQFRTLLQARGIAVSGGVAVGTAPADAKNIAHIDSPPMSQVVNELLTESDNQTAELLVKELGRAKGGAPTTAEGVKVVTRAMERLGLARDGTGATDGSGLDEGNRTSCRLLMNVLDRGGPSSVLGKSLAVAGKTGTLADRFLGRAATGRLRAKTGTLNTVTALTGFVNATQGPVLTFAYVANGEYVSDSLLKLQEAMGDDLVAYPQGPPLRAVGP